MTRTKRRLCSAIAVTALTITSISACGNDAQTQDAASTTTASPLPAASKAKGEWPEPIPTKGSFDPTVEPPGPCDPDGPQSVTVSEPASLAAATKSASADEMKRFVQSHPEDAKSPNAGTALISLMDRHCGDAALVLAKAGAPGVLDDPIVVDGYPGHPLQWATPSSVGDKKADDIRTALLSTIPDYEPRSDAAAAIGAECNPTSQQMDILRAKGYGLTTEFVDGVTRETRQWWENMWPCDALLREIKRPESKKPEGALATIVNFACEGGESIENPPSNEVKHKVVLVRALLEQGYALDDEVTYNFMGEQRKVSAMHLLKTNPCPQGFLSGIGVR